jgi:NarL family two-component system sensor histidine kinase YdfH
MKSDPIEPKRVFQTAAWMWVLYLILQFFIDLAIYNGKPGTPVLTYYLVNFIPAVVFLAVSLTNQLKKGSGIVVVVMILVISLIPVLMNPLFDLKLPQAPLSNVEGMILRQLPVLLIALVLVAWHYNIYILVVYVLVVGILEVLFSSSNYRLADPRLIVFLYTVLIRTISFLVVGVFINQLASRLRAQRESLKEANKRISHYASTLENLTISRERNRMSRELHDTVVHTLSGLAVQLETTKAYLDVDPATVKGLIDQSLEATRSGLHETRRAIKALRATPIDDLGLLDALRQLAQTAAQRANLMLRIELPEENTILSPDVEQCIFRITQEAVENVIHHANAKNLLVQLITSNNDLELLVKDDGIGFHPDANLAPAGHFGLAGMKERSQLVGGELKITSHPNSGTSIKLIIKGCVP